MRKIVDPTWEEFFLPRIKKSGECLFWTKFRDKTGYGRVHIGCVPGIKFAHRLSWFLARGPFDPKLRILHKCDNPMCVNPNHLWIGTQKDNVGDMFRKNRQHPNHGRQLLGEKHPMAKLTERDVLKMRKLRKEKKLSVYKIAAKFGVAPMTAWRACEGKSWTHL